MDPDQVNDGEERALIEKLHREIEKIQILDVQIKNNLNVFEETNNPIEQHLAEYESLAVILQRNKVGSVETEVSKENRDKNFSEDLERELKCLTYDLSKLCARMQTNQQSVLRMAKNLDHLKEMMDMNLNKKDKNNQVHTIVNNVNKRFKAEKNDLKILIDSLFPEQVELQDLIANVVDYYFKEGPDKYYTVEYTDGISELIETLISTTLFETNPRDHLQIKMAELL